MAIRLLLADDSYLIREGISRLLGGRSEIEVVAAAEDLPGLLEAAASLVPDVVLTDVRMPPDHTDEGVRAAAELRVDHPQMGVVVLSQYVDAALAVSLFEQGSAGRAYLLKDRLADLDELVSAIGAVAGGGSVVDSTVVETLVAAQMRAANTPLADLTSREREVLAEMAKGKNNASIASAMGIAERSIEKYIHTIFVKLGLAWEADTHRRVKAVVLYLADQEA
jgi:DNA-binding NarL/FixJ family response regulator